MDNKFNDINEAVNNSLSTLIQTGKVQEIISNKLEKTIGDIVDNLFSSYSPFGSDLKKHIESNLKVNFNKLNLEEYSVTVLKLIEGILNNNVSETAHKQLTNELTKLLKPAPTTITLQKVIDQYIKDNEEDARSEGYSEIGLVLEESSHNFVYIGLNPKNYEEKSSSYSSSTKQDLKINSCEIQIHLLKEDDKYKMGWVSYGGRRSYNTNLFLPTTLHNSARTIYQMYCAGTELILEGDNPFDVYSYNTEYNYIRD